MKMWRFYLKREELHRSAKMWWAESDPRPLSYDRMVKNKYPLYAITNDKEKAHIFMKQRNMDFFILKKSRVDKETWVRFANKNRSAVLDYEGLYTKTGKKLPGNIDETTTVQVLMPYAEKIYVDSLTEDGGNTEVMEHYFQSSVSSDAILPPPNIFIHSIEEQLRVIGYYDIYNWYSGEHLDGFEEEFADRGFVMYPFQGFNISLDELKVYINSYGATFRI